MQVGAATVENRMEILQRTENKIAIRSSSSTSGYLPKENKNTNRLPLVAQLVKNPPAVRETWVGSLGWEDSLEKGKVTHTPVFWPGEFHELYSPWGHKESYTTE